MIMQESKFIYYCFNEVINGNEITFEEAEKLSYCNNIIELSKYANLIARKFSIDHIDVESLINAKSGNCPEDCSFCSQSSFYNSSITKYPLLPTDIIIKRAKEVESEGSSSFCLVGAYRSPPEKDFDQLCKIIKALKEQVSIDINVSLGFLTLERARKLKSLGIKRYNHNLEASESFFSNICKTHDFSDRINTARIVKQAGLELCCGGIIGMGETIKQRIELAFSISSLDPDEVPVNFLIPKTGTPLEQNYLLTTLDAIKTIATWRFIMPKPVLKIAGGREVHFTDNGKLFLKSGANGIISGGYLTTEGNKITEDLEMIREIGFDTKIH